MKFTKSFLSTAAIVGICSFAFTSCTNDNTDENSSDSDVAITEDVAGKSKSANLNEPMSYSYSVRHNIYEDLVGQVLMAPSEDGYFPGDWKWKIEDGEVDYVQELSRYIEASGCEVVTVLAHLHRGYVKIDAEMILKYSQKGSGKELTYSRVTKLTIPKQTDYSKYVELEMSYDFLPALILYNRSNMTLFVGGDYSTGDETGLFSAIMEPHSSKSLVIGNVQSYHVHFAYEK